MLDDELEPFKGVWDWEEAFRQNPGYERHAFAAGERGDPDEGEAVPGAVHGGSSVSSGQVA